MKKNKHDHKGTKALKLTIFFTLMLAPFMAVLFKCCYVTFNKNAKDSYSQEIIQVESKIDFTNFTNVIDGNYYYLDTSNVDTTATYNSASYKIEFSNLQGVNAPSLAKYFTIGAPIGQNNKWSFTFYDQNNSYISYTRLDSLNNNYFSFYILSAFTDSATYFTNSTIGATLSTYTYTLTTSKLDNAFYYAIDEAMDSQYFAWARTSALYTATSGLTTGLGITTQAIPTLIVYWLILTAIYIIIDIVIESFTYITHCIMNRFE